MPSSNHCDLYSSLAPTVQHSGILGEFEPSLVHTTGAPARNAFKTIPDEQLKGGRQHWRTSARTSGCAHLRAGATAVALRRRRQRGVDLESVNQHQLWGLTSQFSGPLERRVSDAHKTRH
jgi:hypothetical protein